MRAVLDPLLALVLIGQVHAKYVLSPANVVPIDSASLILKDVTISERPYQYLYHDKNGVTISPRFKCTLLAYVLDQYKAH